MPQTKTLFFINDTTATKSEIEKRNSMEGKVCFRNANFIVADCAIEKCDFVYGAVPETYKEIPVYGVIYEAENDQKRNAEENGKAEASPKKQAKAEKVKPVWTPNA